MQPLDDTKKQLEEIAAQREKEEKKMREGMTTAMEEEERHQRTRSSKFKPSQLPGQSNKKDWELIVKAFQEKFNKKPEPNGTLVFPTKKDAISFFTEQAAQKRQFLAIEVDQNNKPTGFHCFSCGDGKLYEGTLESIKDQLLKAQTKNSSSKEIKEGLDFISQRLASQPTQQMREELKGMKGAGGVASQEEHKAPTPFDGSRAPKPPIRR